MQSSLHNGDLYYTFLSAEGKDRKYIRNNRMYETDI